MNSIKVSNMSSEHDRAILNSIFNPYLPLGENAFINDVSEIERHSKGKEIK